MILCELNWVDVMIMELLKGGCDAFVAAPAKEGITYNTRDGSLLSFKTITQYWAIQ